MLNNYLVLVFYATKLHKLLRYCPPYKPTFGKEFNQNYFLGLKYRFASIKLVKAFCKNSNNEKNRMNKNENQYCSLICSSLYNIRKKKSCFTIPFQEGLTVLTNDR